MIKRNLTLTGSFLHIPVKTGAPKTALQIWIGGNLLYDFSIELSDKGPHFYCPLDMSVFRNCCIDVMVSESDSVSQKTLDMIVNGEEAASSNSLYLELYQELLRPQFHFSSKRGWLNDPNGLLFCDGLYHLFYQHNPFGTLHAGVNISWGHAVSSDLVHWQECSDAIMPWRRDWLIASGSALLDIENVAGYGKNAIIATFTCLGTFDKSGKEFPAGGQFFAASTNGGTTFYRFSNEPSIGTEHGASWRDPRLFKEGDRFYVAVYECHNEVNGVSFYESSDLHNWELKSWTGGLYECPDIFKLPVHNTSLERWVLYGADGFARIGEFRNGVFIDKGISYPLDYGNSTYAGQTWNHEPNGRRVHISWIRGVDDSREWDYDMGYHDMPFSQCMSIPCTLKLSQDDNGIELYRYPIDELCLLRKDNAETFVEYISGEEHYALHPGTEIIFKVSEASENILFDCFGNCITYIPKERKILFQNKRERKIHLDSLTIRIFIDRTTIEMFFNDGIAATYSMNIKESTLKICGQCKIDYTSWQLKSIWQEMTEVI